MFTFFELTNQRRELGRVTGEMRTQIIIYVSFVFVIINVHTLIFNGTNSNITNKIYRNNSTLVTWTAEDRDKIERHVNCARNIFQIVV